MHTGTADNSTENQVLQHLLAGGSVEEFARSVGLGLDELGQVVDLKRVGRLGRELGGLQRLCEQMLASRGRVEALEGLMAMLRARKAHEPMRRVCKEMLRGPDRGRRGPAPQRTLEACDWLRATLAQGPKPATIVQEMARTRGLAPTTLRRAKSLAGVVTVRRGFGRGGQHLWHLDSPTET